MVLASSIFGLFLLLAPSFFSSSVASTPAKRTYDSHTYYVLEFEPRTTEAHSLIHDAARSLGVEVVERVGELRNHWLVRAPSKTSLGDSSISRRVEDASDPVLSRFHTLKRSAAHPPSHVAARAVEGSSSTESHVVHSIRSVERQVLRQRAKKRAPIPLDDQSDEERAPIVISKASQIATQLGITDPIFVEQWHLANNEDPRYDLNVSGVWAQGITGKGIFTAVIDDGLDANSDDLAANFYEDGSWDFNDHTRMPLPRLPDDQHGTRCSGEIAAVKNDVCGVGVAYEAKISGLRILSGPISDADEAASLNYGYNKTSIYSCSWGPPDDGRSMDAPSLLIRRAVVNGIQNGRDGKGSIFVFASGNGAGSFDQCNFDGYTNSIYSVTVAAIDHKGGHPYYSEACAANLVVAHSSGGGERIHTTDIGKDKCTSSHGGTSAAAPLGAGVIALGLQVRPDLTWRDVQYVVINSALHVNPDDSDWEDTAVAGRRYSYKYGYGALDAWQFVEVAKTWKLVKPQAWVELPQVELNGADINPETGEMTGGVFIAKPNGVESKISVSKDELTENNFETLEHITVRVWIKHARRGDVEVEIVSPNGIKSILGAKRQYDDAATGYPGWQFMSVKHWGESPIGDWTLRVKDSDNEAVNGSFLGWSMTLWGESIDPSKTKLWTFPEDRVGNSTTPTQPDGSSTASEAPTPTVDPSASKTKVIPKPTENLPDDHHTAEGDSSNPAFDGHKGSEADSPKPDGGSKPQEDVSEGSNAENAAPSHSVAPDEGGFDNINSLVSNQTWLPAAFGFVALFMIGAAIFFLRRRAAKQRRDAEYAAVSGEEGSSSLQMRSVGGRGRERGTRGLYDAVAENNDDDDEFEDADENDRLVGRTGPSSSSTPGLQYHDEFLEDDASPASGYKDDDQPERQQRTSAGQSLLDIKDDAARREGSDGSDGSSWEHAEAPSRS